MARNFIILTVIVAVAFMHQSDAGIVSEIDKTVFNMIVDAMDRQGDRIQERVESLKNTAAEIAERAKDAIKQKNERIGRVMNDINEVLERDEVISAKCSDAFLAYRLARDEIVVKTESCVDEKINDGLDHVNQMSDLANEVLAELKELKEEAIQCRDDAHGWLGGILGSVRCGSKLVLKEKAVKARKILPFMKEIAGTTLYLATLAPKLAYCSSEDMYRKIVDNEVLSTLKHCISAFED